MSLTQQARTVHIVCTDSGSPTVAWESSSSGATVRLPSGDDVTLVVGDGQDDLPGENVYLGHAIKMQARAHGVVTLRTSITGFPPIYCYDGPGPLVVSSSIKAIAATPGVVMRFDARGVAEWIRIGKPIQHRTLFKNISLVPAGVAVEISAGKSYRHLHTWSAPSDIQFASYDEYLDAQADAFRAAMRRTDTSRSFLSLTAGLDTRAVLATLAEAGRKIDAVTLSGTRDSLDARHARSLCAALGMRHTIVRQDDTFFRSLQQRTIEAVRLSGGIVGVDGSLEVNMYRMLGDVPPARVSGNLGNQVGRTGTEGVGTRNLSPSWFAESVGAAVRALPDSHWHQQIATSADGLSAMDLIQRESLFASLGNATIGSALSVQQTPYADRQVLSNKVAEPALPDHDTGSARSIRMRDIKHRMFGEPASRSFQRRIVAAAGGPVAQIPINWGWRPRGGMSLPGMLLGGAAGVDAMLTKRKQLRSVLKPITRALGIQGLNGFGSDPLWRDSRTKQFLKDTLQDAVNRSHPLLALTSIAPQLGRGELADEFAEVAAQVATLVLASREFGVDGGIGE